MNPHVFCICATCGRHTLLERSVRLFLEQHYKGQATLLIYNNSEIEQELNLPVLPDNRNVILVNNHINHNTGKPFKSLGEIYNYIVKDYFNFNDSVIACFWDDDDLFLPSHISQGVFGIRLAWMQGKEAYKPKQSYYRSHEGVKLVENTLEPSIFVRFNWIKKYGFSPVTTEQHLQWLNPLVEQDKILVLSDGVPTLIYNWGDNIPTFKTTGDMYNPNNFQNYRKYSQDHGDGKISPISREEVEQYYKINE